MSVDWSKAPEGATHYYRKINCFYDFSDKSNGIVFNPEKEWCSEFDAFGGILTPRPEAKLIYTQAMKGNRDPISVGMLVKHQSVEKEVTLDIDSNGSYVLKSVKLGIYALAMGCDIDYIDTRTDKEKAIDKIIDSTIKEMEICFELKSNHDDSLVSDDTQIGVEFATGFMRNKLIQLLAPEESNNGN